MKKHFALLSACMLFCSAAGWCGSIPEKIGNLALPANAFEVPADMPVIRQQHTGPLKKAAYAETTDATTLYGWTTYNSLWDKNTTNYGVYSFPVQPNTSFSNVWITKNVSSGAWADGRLCGYYVLNYGGAIAIRYYMYDGDNGSLVAEKAYNTSNTTDLYTYYALGLAYNHREATLYGEFLTADGNQVTISTVDQTTGVPTRIVALKGDIIYLAMAFDADGKLYAIGDDGNLYSIDLPSGTTTLIGATGLYPQYYQSATIDPASGRMFWAYMGNDMSTALYEVDLATGHASLASEYGGTVEMVGLYTDHTPAGKVPAPVQDLRVTYTSNAALDGTISFTAPTTCADGSSLGSADINAELYVDYVKVSGAPATVAPGAVYSVDRSFAAGTHKVEVLLSNANGYGARARLLTYAGNDIPGEVRDLTFSLDGRQASLSWEAPATGANGGWFDASGLTYTVVRQPDNLTVATALAATEFTEEIPDRLGNYFYEVTPVSTQPGATAQSNRILYGTAMTVPYKETFDTEAPLDLFAFDDANNDGYHWKWKNGAMADGRGDADHADDWLITPPITLTTDWIYKLRFNAHAVGSYYTEMFNAGVGSTANGSDMRILGSYTVQGDKNVAFEAIVEIDRAGDYRIGIQHSNPAPQSSYDELYVDDIELVPFISAAAPASVENLKVTTFPDDKLNGTISFTAPSKAINGNPITSLTKIEIYRDNALVHTLTDAGPGKDYSAEVDIPQGEHTFNVICHNEADRGRDSRVTAFGGVDIPLPVSNIRYEWNPSDNTKATIRWDASALTGTHGYPLAESDITYSVLAPMWGTMLPEASNLTQCSYELKTTVTAQTLSQRGVQAVTAGGKSETQMVYVNVGPSFKLDAFESFNGGSVNYATWSISSVDGFARWAMYNSDPSVAEAQDGDNGYAMCVIAQGNEGGKGRLISPAFDFSGDQTPWIHFWVLHSTAMHPATTLTIEYTVNGCDYQPLAAPISINDGSNGWKEHHIALSALAGSGRAMLGFTANMYDSASRVAIDNLVIDHTAGVNDVTADNIADKTVVTVCADGIVIGNAAGQKFTVCTTDGKVVAEGTASSDSVTVPASAGIYLVKAGTTVAKVVVK